MNLREFRDHWRVRKLKEDIRNLPARLMARRWHLPGVTLQSLAASSQDLATPILDDLCLPNHSEGPGHNDFVPLLQILRARQPRVVVELGTAHGNTTANICAQCPDATVHTVNALPEQISGDIITFALTRDEIGRVFRSRGYEARVNQIYANTLSLDLSAHLGARSVDLAIIDACHDTPFVINDFHRVAPFMKPGGLMLLHDTHPSMERHLLGSYRACMYLRKEGYDIRHLEDTWWALWVVPPEAVEA
jgi:predicted O-methyltransferase YrrM